MVGNDEGRGSNGGGEGVVEGGGSHLGLSFRHCPCPFTFMGSHLRLCAFVCACAHLFSFAGGCIRSWRVAFVRGWSGSRSCSFGGVGSFLSGLERSGSFLSVCVCLWVVLTLTRCGGGGPLVGGGGGCSSWHLCGGGVGWLVVVNEDDERRRMSSFVVWLPRRTWWASKRRLEGPCACLPGLGTTSSPSSPAVDWVCVLGLVTWRSRVLLVVVVGDDGRRVSPCRRVSSASSLRCGRFVVLDGRGGWVASSMVVVGRKKRRGNV